MLRALVLLLFAGCAPASSPEAVPSVGWGFDVDEESPAGKADGAEEVDAFFAPGSFYYFHVSGWPRDRMTPASLERALAFPGTELRVYRAPSGSPHHCPDEDVG